MDPGNWDYLHWLDMGGPEAVLRDIGQPLPLPDVDPHEADGNQQERDAENLPSLENAAVAHHQAPRRPSFSQRALMDKLPEKMER